MTSLVVVPAQIALCDIDFTQTNLTSDLPGVAAHRDTNLVNPWGIAFGPGLPAWISDNHTGLSTLYNGAGQALPLVVTIPPPSGSASTAAPTGVVFNNTGDFAGSHFIFATEDGTISAWTGGSAATLEVDNSISGAVYKGLALGNNGGTALLYAANFNAGTVDVFNSSFGAVSLGASAFTDPTLPPGYAPFDIANIGGMIYVTYALQNSAKHDDVPGSGHGFVDVYNTAGVLQNRLISGGALDSPWAMAIAPAGFGSFGGDLLVGNFGNGEINVYNPTTGAFIGTLMDSHGNPIVNQGLWGFAFGNGSNGFNANDLYFTAGIPGPNGMVEDHGLFGEIQPTPEPAMLLPLAALSLGLIALRRRKRAS